MIDVKDRVPRYKGRVRLTPVAGQADTYDMTRADDPVEVGTPINRALFKSLEEPLHGAPWTRIFSREVAGPFVWVAPDLFGDGKPYEIGVLIIGGGGSGCAIAHDGGTSITRTSGGGSGFSKHILQVVEVGTSHNIVVGIGGAATTTSATSNNYPHSISGENGGASSFDGKTANGGSRGEYGSGSDDSNANGGVPSLALAGGLYGTEIKISKDSSFDVRLINAINFFEMKDMLGSGGPALYYYSGGKNPETGKGGGNGVNTNISAVAQSADEVGCGGGAAKADAGNGIVATATSGAGYCGAVYIYARKGLTA